MSRDRVRCVECREPLPSDARVCPHCEAVQPSPARRPSASPVAGVFAFVFGVVLALMTIGTTRILGFGLVVVGFGLSVGGYTRHVDRQAERRAR
ncbi:zinc ribbon domain-containing protein [Halorubrum sp. CBA1125]|uniref:zinc ribbon domain-containing protein n=1 Tax=Halorubrum sp. CBA1125 TaxID=2668072 RepID=UPI00135DCC96|nr:zinc ribbon domain-containing protein [Halorubrum sp. CBA1125]MUW14650.1 zinc ribbon domain-containing protein [Halorubrum sp. CBA1125]